MEQVYKKQSSESERAFGEPVVLVPARLETTKYTFFAHSRMMSSRIFEMQSYSENKKKSVSHILLRMLSRPVNLSHSLLCLETL